MRCEYGAAARARRSGNPRAAGKGARRGRLRPRKAHRRQPSPRALGHTEVREPRRERRRPIPGRLHRAHKGRRQLRPQPGRALFDLRRADDCRGNTPLPARQQRAARFALHARPRLPRAHGAREADGGIRPQPDGRRDCRGPRREALRRGLRPRRHRRPGQPLGARVSGLAGLLERARAAARHAGGPRRLAREARAHGRLRRPGREGAAHPRAALLRRQDADRGGAGDSHLAGPGLAPREERARTGGTSPP